MAYLLFNILFYLLHRTSEKVFRTLRVGNSMEKHGVQIPTDGLIIHYQRAENEMYINMAILAFTFLGLLAVIYIYRNHLLQQLRKKDRSLFDQKIKELLREQEISVLSARLDGQEQERTRIAEDLHDRLGSKLAAVKLYYDAAEGSPDPEKMRRARTLLDETIQETRKIAHNITSGHLVKFGLVAAVENLKETLENSHRIKVEFIAHQFNKTGIPKEMQIQLYRMIQELISNILKHARASHITIQLTRHDEYQITLMVEDDGIGFSTDAISSRGIGLITLEDRVKRFNGVLYIDSLPNSGSTITIDLPIPKSNNISHATIH